LLAVIINKAKQTSLRVMW